MLVAQGTARMDAEFGFEGRASELLSIDVFLKMGPSYWALRSGKFTLRSQTVSSSKKSLEDNIALGWFIFGFLSRKNEARFLHKSEQISSDCLEKKYKSHWKGNYQFAKESLTTSLWLQRS